ncbi:MAG TPA: stage III sporulation protein AC [Firmicutes bacterium]|nr:stage III sporulation protein AC [Bacillota bacterium]
MPGIDLIFKITGIGILVAVITMILEQVGKKDYAFIATLAGTVIVLLMIIQKIGELFDTVTAVFRLW